MTYDMKQEMLEWHRRRAQKFAAACVLFLAGPLMICVNWILPGVGFLAMSALMYRNVRRSK